MAGTGRHALQRLVQLVLAMHWRLPWLCSQQEPPRPGNLTECMNWYDAQCPTCRCSTLLTMGYTCDSFAPGTEFQAYCDASCLFGPCCSYVNASGPAVHPCDVIDPHTGRDPCNGRGTCRCGYNATAVCDCEPRYAGERCERCAVGYDVTSYPDCSGTICELLPAIEHGTGNYTSNAGRFPSTGTYECDPGYVFATVATSRTCNRYGKWSGEHIACIGRPCAELAVPGDYSYSGQVLDLQTGSVEYSNGGRYPSEAVYSCYPGYMMGTGHVSRRSCMIDGRWNGGQQSCNAATGHPSGANYSYSHCCPEPQGNGRRRYGSPDCWQGQWTYDSCCLATPPPACIGINCAAPMPPGAIEHGVVSLPANDGIFPSWQAVTCEAGYEFQDEATIGLNESTRWCGAPELLALGLPNAAHMCLIRECSTEGRWFPDVQPICGGIMCQDPEVPTNGSVSEPTNAGRYPSTVSYECDAGFELVGPPDRRCSTSGGWVSVSSRPDWTSMVPYCRGIRCDSIRYPPDGSVAFSNSRRYPSVATYSCDAGFALTGEVNRWCAPSGEWGGDEPICRGCGPGCGVCDRLPPTVGVLSNCTAPQDCCDTVCMLTCAPGFSGPNATMTCAGGGNWSGTAPSCQQDCSELEDPGPSQLVYTIYTANESNRTVRLNFSEAFTTLAGDEVLDEFSGGSWYETTEGISDPLLRARVPHGTERVRTCSPGYVAITDHSMETSVCMDGAFTHATLRCVPACELPELQPHAVSNCSETVPSCTLSSNCTEPTHCEARCEEGFSGQPTVSSCELGSYPHVAEWSRLLSLTVCYTNCAPPEYDSRFRVVGEMGELFQQIWSNETNSTNATDIENDFNVTFVWNATVETIIHGRSLNVSCESGLLARNIHTRGPFVGPDILTCDNGTLNERSIECAKPSLCLPGTADVDGDEFTPCEDCPPGFYADGRAVFCSACPAGRFGTGSRLTSSDCQECAAGKYSETTGRTRSTDCIDCSAGAYAEASGNDAEADCIDCDAGKYSDIVGSYVASDCINCAVGTFSETLGLGTELGCTACPPGRYSTVLGSNSSSDCQACTPVEHAEVNATYTCTTSENTRTSGCTTGYWVSAGVSDTCEPCDDMQSRPSVESCRRCTDGTVETCADAVCSPGYHTYNSVSQTCTPCTEVAHAAEDARYTCTSAGNSRVDECALGYFVAGASDAESADRCELCSDMRDRVSVDSCSRCSDNTTESCSVAACAAGYHSYDSTAQTCIPCTRIRNAAADSRYTCTAASNSRVSHCRQGFFVEAAILAGGADRCEPCNDMRSRRSVNDCLQCVDAAVETCRVATCAVGYHTYDNLTQSCTPCTSVAHAAHDASYTCTSAGNSRVNRCLQGYFLNGAPHVDVADTCEPCDDMQSRPSVESCRRCTDGTVETCADAVCSPGYHTYNSVSQTCTPCTEVAHAAEDARYTCTSAGNSRVDECALGYFVAGASDAESADRCELCSDMRDRVSVDSCSRCSDNTTESCSVAACAAGYHSYSMLAQTCVGCEPGKYVETVGSTHQDACIDCDAGFHLPTSSSSNATDCIACALGQYAAPGSASCENCQPGRFNDFSSAVPCGLCGIGKYSLEAATTCIECAAGQADDDSDASTPCIKCAMGTYAPPGRGGLGGCQPCALGTFDHDFDAPRSAATPCAPCDIGRAQNLTGQIQCDICPPGTHQGLPEQAVCELCSAGKYSVLIGSNSSAGCIECPAGRFQGSRGKSTSSDCLECATGTYASNGSSVCAPCRAGTADLDRNPTTVCQRCSAGFFSDRMSVICQECQSGWADLDVSASSECERCPTGTFSGALATNCTKCESGKADVDLDPATVCSLCENGTFSPTASTECVACASGFADLDMDPASACETCGEGVLSDTGLTECPLIYCSRYSVRHARVAGSILFRDEDGKTYPDNAASIVTCDAGFSISTSVVQKRAYRRCTVNSTWDVPAPECVSINCSLAPNCAALLRTGCVDTMHTCGPCLPGYASMLAEGDGNDPCGILALVFNASVEISGIPPKLDEFTAAIENAALNASGGSPAHAEIISYVQVVHQQVQGLPGAPEDYMVPGPSTAWGAPARQVEEGLRLMIGNPDSSVTVADITTMQGRRRRQLTAGGCVSVAYTIVSSIDVSNVVSGYSNTSFLEALKLAGGPITVFNSTAEALGAGPLAVDASSPLQASEPIIFTKMHFVLTVRVTSAPASVLARGVVSETLQDAVTLGRFVDDASNRTILINRLDLLSVELVHLPLPPPPPPPPCGAFGIMCITTGIESHYIVLAFVGVAFLWWMCGLCQAVNDKLVAKHQRKVHVEAYPSVHCAEGVLREKRRQAEQIITAMADRVDSAQLDSLKWRVGEQAIVDQFVDMKYEECVEFKPVFVERGDKLPGIEMHLQPLEDTTIEILIEHLEELKLDTRNLQRPPPWWKATARKHNYFTYCIYGILSSFDMVLHGICASVFKDEGQVDEGIHRLYNVAFLSLVLRVGLSAVSAVYSGWYLHEVGLNADFHRHLTRTLLTYQRTRRRSHHERIEVARKLVSTEVTTFKAVARWGAKSKPRPQSAPAGQIFHDFALKTAPLPTIRDSENIADAQQDFASEAGDDADVQQPLQIADRLKGGHVEQRPKSAGQVQVATHRPVDGLVRPRPQSAAADAMTRALGFEKQLARLRPQSAAGFYNARPQSAGSIASRPGSAAPAVVSQYPPQSDVNLSLAHKRPATASVARVSEPAALVRTNRPSTASGYLSPSKIQREAAAAALAKDQQGSLSSNRRPQSASAALVGLQAQLITYFEETPAAVRRSSAGGQRRTASAGSAPARSKLSDHSRTAIELANGAGEDGIADNAHAAVSLPDDLVVHKRPVSAPLNLFHDFPRQTVVQLNAEASTHMRTIQTHAAALDRKQRAARKRSQKLQDAADLGALRLQHLKKLEQDLGRQQPQSAPANVVHESENTTMPDTSLDFGQSKLRPSKLEPIAERHQLSLPVQLKRPKSAAGVMMTLGGGIKPGDPSTGKDAVHGDGAGTDEDDVGEDETQSNDEDDESELVNESGSVNSVHLSSDSRANCQQVLREHGACAVLRRGFLATLCLLNPFALAAALCVYRKHEGPTPLVLAVVYNLWVIISDVPMACVLLDYSLRREMLTVTSVLDGGDASIWSRIAAADEEGAPWVAIKIQLPKADTTAQLAVYTTMAWTAFHLCLHLSVRWMFCARCCCDGFSCKRSMLKLCLCCKPKPRVVVSNAEELQARAQLYVTAGTHQHHSKAGGDEGDEQQQLAVRRSTGLHRTRPRSARPGSGGTHHEVDVLLERPRSATLLRTPGAPAPAPVAARGPERKAGSSDNRAAPAVASVPHEVAEFDVVRPRPRSAVPLPALHSLRESSHGEDAGNVNQSLW